MEPQSLFWSVVTITPPPRPKRMVEKEFVRWINAFDNGTITTHETLFEADHFAENIRKSNRLGEAERIVIKRLVEE